MASLAAQPESVVLANEAVTLPLEQATRRSQLIWRLDGIVRREPDDIVARTALGISLLIDGNREAAEAQLKDLLRRRDGADFLSRKYLARTLGCIGWIEDASTVLYEALEKFPRENWVGAKDSFASLGLLIGDIEFYRRALGSNDGAERAALELIETHNLEQPIRLLTESLAETVCRVARDIDHTIILGEFGEVDCLHFGYLAPLPFKKRWQIERECIKSWREKLRSAGLSWAAAAPFMTIGLDPFPSESQAAA